MYAKKIEETTIRTTFFEQNILNRPLGSLELSIVIMALRGSKILHFQSVTLIGIKVFPESTDI